MVEARLLTWEDSRPFIWFLQVTNVALWVGHAAGWSLWPSTSVGRSTELPLCPSGSPLSSAWPGSPRPAITQCFPWGETGMRFLVASWNAKEASSCLLGFFLNVEIVGSHISVGEKREVRGQRGGHWVLRHSSYPSIWVFCFGWF